MRVGSGKPYVCILQGSQGLVVSTSFLRGKFLALIVIKSFSRLDDFAFYPDLLSPVLIHQSFWYLLPGGSDSEPALVMLGGILYTITPWFMASVFSCVAKELFISGLRRGVKVWTRSYYLVLSLVGLLSSLVPRWDFHTLLTDPPLPGGRYYLLMKTKDKQQQQKP